jgi:hypothetical protein
MIYIINPNHKEFSPSVSSSVSYSTSPSTHPMTKREWKQKIASYKLKEKKCQ